MFGLTEKGESQLTAPKVLRVRFLSGESKVGEHELRSSLGAENVLGLQISMEDLTEERAERERR